MSLRYKKLYVDSTSLVRPAIGDAGYDLRAYGNYILSRGTPTTINTGIAVEIPSGYVGLIFPRSGLRAKARVSQYGTGVIDSSFRGELKMITELHTNTPHEAYHILSGDKIAQLVIVPYYVNDVEEVSELSTSPRGVDGFGSTGR